MNCLSAVWLLMLVTRVAIRASSRCTMGKRRWTKPAQTQSDTAHYVISIRLMRRRWYDGIMSVRHNKLKLVDWRRCTYVGTGDQTRCYTASPRSCLHRTCCILPHRTHTYTRGDFRHPVIHKMCSPKARFICHTVRTQRWMPVSTYHVCSQQKNWWSPSRRTRSSSSSRITHLACCQWAATLTCRG